MRREQEKQTIASRSFHGFHQGRKNLEFHQLNEILEHDKVFISLRPLRYYVLSFNWLQGTRNMNIQKCMAKESDADGCPGNFFFADYPLWGDYTSLWRAPGKNVKL